MTESTLQTPRREHQRIVVDADKPLAAEDFDLNKVVCEDPTRPSLHDANPV